MITNCVILYSPWFLFNEYIELLSFRRSHFFRELLISNMQHVMELTCETSSDQLLPPPRSVALSLKCMALQCIQDWNREYGDGYKKLQLGYNFLKHCKKAKYYV
jgi:hypothetical protein